MMVRSYRLPKIPVTKQTVLHSKKNHGRSKQNQHTTKEKQTKAGGKVTASNMIVAPIKMTKAESGTDDSDSN